MVHKKYIKRGNKIFGPYYYENYRVGNKVKSRYLGTTAPSKINRDLLMKGSMVLIIFCFAAFLLITSANYTGYFIGGKEVSYSEELSLKFHGFTSF